MRQTQSEYQRRYREKYPEKYKALTTSPAARARRKATYAANREQAISYTVQWQRENPDLVAIKARRSKYGLEDDQYRAMLVEQNSLCAICHKPETRRNKAGRVHGLCVDHDHATGLVRGLICHRCNAAIGYADDSPEMLMAMSAYLLRSRGASDGN